MKIHHLRSWITAAFVFSSAAMVYAQQDAMEKSLEQERAKDFQYGGELPEEKAYYEEVAPENIPNGQNYLQKNHPIPNNTLPANKIPENRIPDNKIPENSLPENPI